MDYGAAKAALLNVSKALSRSSPEGIRINSVSQVGLTAHDF